MISNKVVYFRLRRNSREDDIDDIRLEPAL